MTIICHHIMYINNTYPHTNHSYLANNDDQKQEDILFAVLIIPILVIVILIYECCQAKKSERYLSTSK